MMTRMESFRGNLYRIRECAVDLLSVEDDLAFDDGEAKEDDSSWEFIGRNLCLRSTFMYCDLSSVISGTGDGEAKRSLIHLANQFFQHMEELEDAVKIRSISKTQSCYHELIDALQELMTTLLPPSSPLLNLHVPTSPFNTSPASTHTTEEENDQ